MKYNVLIGDKFIPSDRITKSAESLIKKIVSGHEQGKLGLGYYKKKKEVTNDAACQKSNNDSNGT